MTLSSDRVPAIDWRADHLALLDQRCLPDTEQYLEYRDAPAVADAIAAMVVRGAPAIGIAAAYAMVLSVRAHRAGSASGWRDAVTADMNRLARARPTAVNLCWALARMRRVLEGAGDKNAPTAMEIEACRIHAEDVAANVRMGEIGGELLASDPGDVMTHCNAGALATGGFGTALGVVRAAHRRGLLKRVYAGETRPWLQGARLTAWELVREGIPVTLVADGAAAHLMRQGRVRWVIVGADRITLRGDVVNKIGTYALAIAARHHGVRFMVVAPVSTVDATLHSGEEVAIEARSAQELLEFRGVPLAAAGASAWNPSFDVTPAELVDVIVTERGVVQHPHETGLSALLDGPAGVPLL